MRRGEAKAVRLFREAMALLAKLPPGWKVYTASGTPHLMKGDSHDDEGHPRQHSIVDTASGVTID